MAPTKNETLIEVDNAVKLSDAEVSNLIESWKQAIDVQKHFNEICLKVRNTAITTLGAGLAATGLLVDNKYNLLAPTKALAFVVGIIFIGYFVLKISEKLPFNLLATFLSKRVAKVSPALSHVRFRFLILADMVLITVAWWHFSGYLVRVLQLEHEYQLNMGGVCLFALALVLFIFYVLDRNWYHQLLKGAVRSSNEIEQRLERAGISSFTLGRYIKIESDVRVGNLTINAGRKLEFVYLGVIVTLFFMAGVLSVYGSGLVGKNPKTISELNKRISTYRSENLKLKDTNQILIDRIDSMRIQADIHQREHDLQEQLIRMYKKYVPLDSTLIEQ